MIALIRFSADYDENIVVGDGRLRPMDVGIPPQFWSDPKSGHQDDVFIVEDIIDTRVKVTFITTSITTLILSIRR